METVLHSEKYVTNLDINNFKLSILRTKAYEKNHNFGK